MQSMYHENNPAAFLFHQGTNFSSYEYLGVHKTENESGGYRYTFHVWAPNADAVYLVGDIWGWEIGMPMLYREKDGIWRVDYASDEPLEGTFYKFRILKNGRSFLKSDPYAFYSQTEQDNASIVYDFDKPYDWTDAKYMAARRKAGIKSAAETKKSAYCSRPMSIYEVHLGSWKRKKASFADETAENTEYLTYREIADELAEYVKEMGFTHIEIMPIAEHPFDGSWGYQVCSFFAPTSRYGTPDDFKYFVDKFHSYGIGVFMDWVPAHFPKDAHGLYEFDGVALYEYQGIDRMEHAVWGTRFFDVGRTEVQSFLVSNALYWLRKFHIDGLRIDAVASMLYLDFDRRPGEWNPNPDGSNINRESVSFFKKLNTAVKAEFPDVYMIAEESADWKMITHPVEEGGLGFDFKWNMGWANDMYDYVQIDPIYRKHFHQKLTFPLMYAFDEHYILPISHDEVVHGKKSLVDKMFGEYDDKFAAMRTFLLNMYTLPGKKMMFMGTEYGQFREWDYASELEWFMLKYPRHTEMHRYVKALNAFYTSRSELWDNDNDWDGFQWIYSDLTELNLLVYRRINKRNGEVIVVLNFAPVQRDGFEIAVSKAGKYRELFSTDEYRFGGKNVLNEGEMKSFKVKLSEKESENRISVTIPANGGIVLKRSYP